MMIFITNNIKPSRFLKNLPRDIAVSNVLDLSGIEHILANNLSLINKHFSKHEILKTNFLNGLTLNINVITSKLFFCYLGNKSLVFRPASGTTFSKVHIQ